MSKSRFPSPPPKGMVGPRVNCLSRIIRIKFNEVLNDEGLFSGQHHIIMLLFHNDGQTVGQIAKHLGVAPATASVSIKRMEKAGFIKRKADEKDARTVKIFLTDKGRSVMKNIGDKMNEQEKRITSCLTEEEISVLSDMLDKIIKNIIAQENIQEQEDKNV